MMLTYKQKRKLKKSKDIFSVVLNIIFLIGKAIFYGICVARKAINHYYFGHFSKIINCRFCLLIREYKL
jgi:hypothetical protein